MKIFNKYSHFVLYISLIFLHIPYQRQIVGKIFAKLLQLALHRLIKDLHHKQDKRLVIVLIIQQFLVLYRKRCFSTTKIYVLKDLMKKLPLFDIKPKRLPGRNHYSFEYPNTKVKIKYSLTESSFLTL